MRNPILILVLTFTLYHFAIGQLEATLTIENQHTEGTDFYFDIFLYRSSGSTNGDIYLRDADFYLSFNDKNFKNPHISKTGSSPGYCTFEPSSGNSTDNLLTAINYFDNTIASLNGKDQIVIELNGPVPSDQTAFNSTVAKINNSSSTHCLGRFKISGINNPFGTSGLKWVTTGSSLVTTVLSMENTSPFFASEISVNTVNPVDVALPIELISFNANIYQENKIQLVWQTANEFQNYGFEIEKRRGNNQWEKIGFLAGNQGQTANLYSFIDPAPSKGINFYRLKQLDVDGKFTYSQIVSVYFSNDDGLDVFPNPVSYNLFVEGTKGGFYTIVNSVGKIVLDGTIEKESIDVSELSSGIYVLLNNGKTAKFLKW
ncbi:MAG: T9SS type A sorting domain-containing protein [Saprospiraceae bacterium]|nr:T9SS type A sorting domain-containing protein [Saprospiraceae bacterium]